MFDRRCCWWWGLVGAILAVILGPAQVLAVTLSGFVSDIDDGESLPLASVVLTGVQLGSVSNSSGYYAVTDVPAGIHEVVISHVGYKSRRDTLTFAGEDLRLDVALRIESVDLEEVVIQADRSELERQTQSSFISLQAEPLQQMPAIGEADLLRSLQLLPGIQSASDISSGLYVRGGGPDQTAILLDQIPLYNPSHAFGFFSTFNPDAIKDVNLYKGAYPAPYGRTLGAVLDVSNREGNRQQFSGRGGVSLISGRLLAEGPVGQGSWMLAGRRTYLDPVLDAIRSRGVDVPSYYFYDFNGKINQRRGDDTFTASTYWGQDDLRLDLDSETFIDLRWGNRALTGRWTHVFSPALFGHFMVAGSSYKSTTSLSFFDTPILLSNSIRDLSLKGDIDYFLNPKHTLSLGFLATLFKFRFLESFNQQEQSDLREEPLLASFYAQDEWLAGPTTRVRLGGRATFFSEADRWHFMPRFSYSRALAPEVRVKAAGGMYRQYLQLVTTEGFSGGDFWVPLDGSVEPGRSYQGVVGTEWTPTRRYQFSLEGYYTDLANLVVLDNSVAADSDDTRSADIFKTGGSGWAGGVELFLQRRTGALTGWIGYTLGWTRRTFAELNQGQSFPPKYDRRHDVSFVVSYKRGKWRYGSSLVYATGQAFTPATARYTMRSPATMVTTDYVLPAERNSGRLLPYHRLDVSINRAFALWGAEVECYLQIFNVYSRRNEWFVQYDTDNPDTDPEVVKQLPIVPTFGFNFSF
ncbi:MAG: TonB-dependent receptor plug domain-containing protein [Candidatus Latescibacteria bacterium]|nr:TonB-dependent receptor plug domain-containing protein [Candidatus Latescibacterota bacterium]